MGQSGLRNKIFSRSGLNSMYLKLFRLHLKCLSAQLNHLRYRLFEAGIHLVYSKIILKRNRNPCYKSSGISDTNKPYGKISALDVNFIYQSFCSNLTALGFKSYHAIQNFGKFGKKSSVHLNILSQFIANYAECIQCNTRIRQCIIS